MQRVVLLSVAALASGRPAAVHGIEAEIDCSGEFQPGDDVPFTVRVEAPSAPQGAVDLRVTISPPGVSTKTLFEKRWILGDDLSMELRRTVSLPVNAPTGHYELDVVADNGAAIVSGGCDFDVI